MDFSHLFSRVQAKLNNVPPGSNRERHEIEYNSQEYRPNNSLFKVTLPQNFDPLLQPGPHELAKTILLVYSQTSHARSRQ